MKDYFINLFVYENWANKVITDCIVSISEPPEKAMSVMSHVFNAQMLWLSRINKQSADIGVWDIYDKGTLVKVCEKSSGLLEKFSKEISESDLNNSITYTNTKGEKFTSKLEDILTHLALHSPYHRGQVIVLIKPLTQSLPYTDYIHYVRNVKAAAI